MNEAKVTTELTNMFSRLWLWPHKIPDTAATAIIDNFIGLRRSSVFVGC